MDRVPLQLRMMITRKIFQVKINSCYKQDEKCKTYKWISKVKVNIRWLRNSKLMLSLKANIRHLILVDTINSIATKAIRMLSLNNLNAIESCRQTNFQ